MSETYNAEEYALGYPEGIEDHFWHIARHDALQQALQTLQLQDRPIMDVGCGMGITTRFLRECGFNILGIEHGDAPVATSDRGFISTGQDLFELSSEQKHDINCVLLLDVLEHITEREAFLNKIHEQLPNCQYLLLTVPARRELWGEFDRFWGHQLRYDRPTLAAELDRSGFTVRSNSYYFHLVYLAGLVIKALGIERGTSFSPLPRSGLRHWIHKVLGLYGRLENRLVPGFLPGSSILCVAARKPE